MVLSSADQQFQQHWESPYVVTMELLILVIKITILEVDDFEGIAQLKTFFRFNSYFLVHLCPVDFLDFYGSRSVTVLLIPPAIFRQTPQ